MVRLISPRYNQGSLRAWFGRIEGGAERITSRTAPVITIPTNVNTGSDVGRGAILILDDGREVGERHCPRWQSSG